MVNSDGLATATFPGADSVVGYDGDTAIAGVPGTAAAVVLDIAGTEGSATGALLPTGHITDVIDGITVTCIDNGMPVVVVPATELGGTGYETVAELEADTGLGQRVQALRLAAGVLMGLGDMSAASVPKISLVAAPADGGTTCTRTSSRYGCTTPSESSAQSASRPRCCSTARPEVTWRSSSQVRRDSTSSTRPGTSRSRSRSTGRAAAQGPARRRRAHCAQALRRHRLPPEAS